MRTSWDGLPVAAEPPYGCTVVVHRERAGRREFLLLHRSHHGPDYAGDWAWTPPAGSRLPGEELLACALRELAEEAGLTGHPVTAVPGAAASWALFTCAVPADAEVRLVDPEHDAYRWVEAHHVLPLLSPQPVRDAFRLAVSSLSIVDSLEPRLVVVPTGLPDEHPLLAGLDHQMLDSRPIPPGYAVLAHGTGMAEALRHAADHPDAVSGIVASGAVELPPAVPVPTLLLLDEAYEGEVPERVTVRALAPTARRRMAVADRYAAAVRAWLVALGGELPVAPIATERLDLVSLSGNEMAALLWGPPGEADRLVRMDVPAGWADLLPLPFRLTQLAHDPSERPWLLRAIVRREPTREIVGHAGLHARPDGDGMVEIGYSVLPAHRRRGYAREAATGLLEWASRQPGVRRLRATTTPTNAASLGLLDQLGFAAVGTQWDEDDGEELVLERDPIR